MKKFLILLTIAFTCLALFSTVAEAKRLGGGSSFGKSRAMPSQQYRRAPDAAPAKNTVQAPTSNRSKWLGPLAGLAIGAGLGSMLGGGLGGMGGGMSSLLMMLLVAAVVMFLISKFKKSQQQLDLQYAGDSTFNTTSTTQSPSNSGSSYANGVSANVDNIPANFPVDSFIRNSKASFIRLQAANDRKDLNDIREYTTPEMFAEISMQIQERGNVAQQTDVLSINAELLEVAKESDYTIASVRFTGLLSENNNTPESIDEIWHIQKYTKEANAAWLLAGIQQTSLE